MNKNYLVVCYDVDKMCKPVVMVALDAAPTNLVLSSGLNIQFGPDQPSLSAHSCMPQLLAPTER